MTLCRCGHPESEHGLYPPHECLIERNRRMAVYGYGVQSYTHPPCGCERFVEAKDDARTR